MQLQVRAVGIRDRIQGIDGMSQRQIDTAILNGGRFVMFQYCFSLIFVSYKRRSDIYFVKAGERAAVKGLKFTLFSGLLGWWGIPWGIVFTVQTLATNLRGGKDVTQPVLASLAKAG